MKNLRDTTNLRISFTFAVIFVLTYTLGPRLKGPPANARSRLSPTYSRPPATNAPEKLIAGRPFWCPYMNAEIYRCRRAQEHYP